MTKREDAIEIFKTAVAAVQPAQLMSSQLVLTSDALQIGGQSIPRASFDKIYIIGAGKAAAAMALETEKILDGHIRDGLVVTKYGHSLPTTIIKIISGAHPVPDQNCLDAVTKTLTLLKSVTENDIVICLLSGGASSLWCDVPNGLTLGGLQITFDYLLKSGAAIDEINVVRKHLSTIKGGQLVRYCSKARLFSLIISDVPYDNLEIIASGPTVGDESTFGDAYSVLLKYNLFNSLPLMIRNYIEKGIEGAIPETPKPSNELFYNTSNKIIGSNRISLQAAAAKAKSLGYYTKIAQDLKTGDAEEEAKKLVCILSEYPGEKPVCFIQGGETTVKVTGGGKGGRNQHFALVVLNELMKLYNKDICKKITLLSGGTDGSDGPTEAAGAIVDIETITKTLQKNLVAEVYIKNNDAYHFFEQVNGLLIVGPTQTNVMDIMIAIISKASVRGASIINSELD